MSVGHGKMAHWLAFWHGRLARGGDVIHTGEAPVPRRGHELTVAALAFGLGVLSAIACRYAGGGTLGLYLAPLVFVVLLVAPLVLAVPHSLLAAGVVPLLAAAGVSVIWLTSGPAAWGEVFACALVLLSVALLAGGLALILARGLGSATVGGAVAVVVLLVWLTWPIWLSASLESSAGQRLTPQLTVFQPLLAVNAVVKELGIWTQQRVMYNLTALGQHVSYGLPESIWPCVLAHGLTGLALGAMARRRRTMSDKA